MADAEIEIKATADAAEAQQQLERTAAAIERVAVAVQDAAERLRTFDLSPLSEALASFESSAARTKSLSGAVSGWRDEVEGAKASAEATVDAIGDLSLRLEDVAQGLRDGSMSSEQAIAATQKIRDEYKALSTESQEFRQAVRELYGDLQSASAVAAAAAEKEGQAAEKSLQKIEQASERKRRARELEAQSAEALREKLEALRSEEEAARSSGNMPAAADAAQQAAAVEQALQRRSAAEQRAADREEQMASRRQTRLSLEGKSYVELARHLKALVAAREEAAQAGDGEAYDQLTAQIKGTRAAVEDLTTRTNIARTAMLGKAQAGMMVADQMGQLANGFRDGSVSAAGFATTIMSVGMAIKAGLGPIGWAMAAVQALQMAWDSYARSQKEAAEESQKAHQKNLDTIKELIAAQKQLLAQSVKSDAGAQVRELQRVTDAEREALSARQENEEAAMQHRLDMAREETKQRLAEIEHLVEAQQMTKEQAAEEKRAAKERLRQAEESARAEGEARRETLLAFDRDTAERELDLLRRLSSEYKEKWGDVLKSVVIDDSELVTLQQQVKALEIQRENEGRILKDLKDEVERNSWTYNPNLKDVKEQKERLDQEIENQRAKIAHVGGQITEAQQRLADAQRRYQEQTEAAYQAAKDLPQFAGMTRDEVLETVRSLQDNNRALTEQLDQAQQTALLRQQALETAQRQADYAEELARLRNKGIEAEDNAYLQRIRRENARLREEEALQHEKTSKQQHETALRDQISADLDRLLGYTRTSVSYSQRDTRSRAEILSSDRALLKARLSELRQAQLSAQEAGAGPETIKQINEKMRATRNALSGLEQSAREAAIEVLRSLNKDKEGASVDLVAMLRRDQVKVDRAAEKIARQADAAARYLDAAATARRAGDQDAEERYYAAYERRIAGMQKLGASVDRMTVTGDMGTSEVQRLLGNLRIQEQVQMRRNRAGLRLADSEERQAQRAQRDAAASRVQAPARPGGAEAAPAPAAQEEQYRAEVAQLRQAAELLREQNRQMGGFVTQCTRALGDMAASCRAMADQLASATGQIAAVQQQMRNVNASVRATARGAV